MNFEQKKENILSNPELTNLRKMHQLSIQMEKIMDSNDLSKYSQLNDFLDTIDKLDYCNDFHSKINKIKENINGIENIKDKNELKEKLSKIFNSIKELEQAIDDKTADIELATSYQRDKENGEYPAFDVFNPASYGKRYGDLIPNSNYNNNSSYDNYGRDDDDGDR